MNDVPLGKTELLQYLYEYFWTLVTLDPPQRTRDLELVGLVARFLLSLWRHADRISERQDADLRFVPTCQAVALKQSAQVMIAEPGNIRCVREIKAFYDDDVFYRRCVNAVKSPRFESCRTTGYLQTRSTHHDHLERIFPDLAKPSGSVRFRGFVLGGVDDGVVWLGVRQSTTVSSQVKQPGFSSRACARILKLPEDQIIWRQVEVEPVRPWFDRPDTIGDEELLRLHRAVARAVLGEASVVVRNVDVFPTGSALMMNRSTAVLFVDANDYEGSVLQGAQRASKAENIVFWSTGPVQKLMEAVGQMKLPSCMFKREVAAIGSEHLPGYLGKYPWVWTQFFGRNLGIHVAPAHTSELGPVLLEESHVPVIEQNHALRHPAIAGRVPEQGVRWCIVGARGCGKSTAAYQLLRGLASDTLILVVQERASMRACDILEALVASFVAERPVCVVVDEFSRWNACDPAAAARFLRWAAQPANRRVVIVLTGAADTAQPVDQDERLKDYDTIRVYHDETFFRAVIGAHLLSPQEAAALRTSMADVAAELRAGDFPEVWRTPESLYESALNSRIDLAIETCQHRHHDASLAGIVRHCRGEQGETRHWRHTFQRMGASARGIAAFAGALTRFGMVRIPERVMIAFARLDDGSLMRVNDAIAEFINFGFGRREGADMIAHKDPLRAAITNDEQLPHIIRAVTWLAATTEFWADAYADVLGRYCASAARFLAERGERASAIIAARAGLIALQATGCFNDDARAALALLYEERTASLQHREFLNDLTSLFQRKPVFLENITAVIRFMSDKPLWHEFLNGVRHEAFVPGSVILTGLELFKRTDPALADEVRRYLPKEDPPGGKSHGRPRRTRSKAPK